VETVPADEAEVEQRAAEQEDPEPEGVQSGKRQVARADHQGNEIVREAEDDRNSHEEDHGRAVDREETIEGVGRYERESGPGELKPDQERLDASDHEKDQARDDVHDPEPLVIYGHDPVVQDR